MAKARSVEDAKELFSVVYTVKNDTELEKYFNDSVEGRIKYTTYRKILENGEFKSFEPLAKITTTNFNTFKDYKFDKSITEIYRFIENQTFTVILFDSRDYDSLLCKDIVVKQYVSAYGRNVKDWRKNGVIIYDTNPDVDSSIYETYEGSNYFDLKCLSENDIDEVFLCGYNIDTNIYKQFVRSGERVFVFENNPFKINLIRSIVKSSYDVTYCMSKTTNKAFQAYTLFRDPIGNIKISDSVAFEILKNYSDMYNKNFDSCEDWERLEKVSKWFEEKITDETWRKTFVDSLFGTYTNDVIKTKLEYNTIDSVIINDNEQFTLDMLNYSYEWTNKVIVINTREIPTYNQVNKIITEDQSYNQIVTFFKDDKEFWTLRVYKTDRPIVGGIDPDEAKPIDEDGIQNIWYTKTGVPVVKVVSYNDVKWFNIAGKRKTEINGYEVTNLTPETTSQEIFLFDITNKKYILYDSKYFNDDNILKTSNGSVKKFIKSNKTPWLDLSQLFKDTNIIDFNSLSLSNLLRNKYYCQGNKFTVTASLTDRQMYECLKTKSILG